MSIFENRKLELANALATSNDDLISDVELIIQDRTYYAEKLGGQVAFWDEFIDWLDSEFRNTRDIPMSRVIEKQIVIQALQGCDSKLMSVEDHTRLFADLMRVLNGSATTLAANRMKGGKASRKITSAKVDEITSRFNDLQRLHPHRRKNAHIETLSEEFDLSSTSLKSILPKKVKR